MDTEAALEAVEEWEALEAVEEQVALEVTEEWEDLVVIITADTCRHHRQEDMGTEDITDRIMAADV